MDLRHVDGPGPYTHPVLRPWTWTWLPVFWLILLHVVISATLFEYPLGRIELLASSPRYATSIFIFIVDRHRPCFIALHVLSPSPLPPSLPAPPRSPISHLPSVVLV